jgi:mannose-6-phosphate isomerase-like protein (cupin superfamily)
VKLRRAQKRRTVLTTERWITSPRSGAKLLVKQVPERGSGEPLVVERVLLRGMYKAPPHVHLDFAETYTVLEGVADAKLGDDALRLSKQEGRNRLWIGKGRVHVNPWNADIDQLHIEQSFAPATDGVRAYIATLADMLAQGTDHNGDLPWSLVLAIADVTRERTYLSRASFSLQRRLLLPLGNVAAGTRGYKVVLTRSPATRPRR